MGLFDDVSAVLYLVALSHYAMRAEDSSKNRLRESLEVRTSRRTRSVS